MEKIKDKALGKVMEQMMSMAKDPKMLMRNLAENISPMELNIKIHGIKKMKDKDEERLFISILMPKVETPEIPELEEPEEKK